MQGREAELQECACNCYHFSFLQCTCWFLQYQWRRYAVHIRILQSSIMPWYFPNGCMFPEDVCNDARDHLRHSEVSLRTVRKSKRCPTTSCTDQEPTKTFRTATMIYIYITIITCALSQATEPRIQLFFQRQRGHNLRTRGFAEQWHATQSDSLPVNILGSSFRTAMHAEVHPTNIWIYSLWVVSKTLAKLIDWYNEKIYNIL